MAIKTEMLRYFVEVAESGNLAEAATKLGRTPSAVSMMLKQLEADLGAPLFETDRKNRLTPLGIFTLQEAKRELNHFRTTVEAIKQFALSGEGQVRVACLPGISSALMPLVVGKLHSHNPLILIYIRDMLTEAVLGQIRGETVDIGIVNTYSDVGFSNIKSTPILTDRFGILARRDSPIGRKETLHWSDLSLEKLIFNGLCRSIDDPYVRRASTDAFIAVESALTIQSFVRQGAGVAVLPELVGRHVATDLVFRIPEGPVYTRTAHLVWNENHRQSPAVLRFCKILREIIAEYDMLPDEDALAAAASLPELTD